jgi:protein required for attachment to host cells
MRDYCVVIADGSRARFFRLMPAEIPEMESGPNLVEFADLVNPEHPIQNKELWSDNKTGRNRGSSGSPHGYDDHRDQHQEEYERRFARNVAETAANCAQTGGIKQFILVAQKRMLGYLRAEITPLSREGVEIRDLAKDLSKLNPLDLHQHLSREGLLPERKTPTA